jgi:hypothetical protein
MRFAAAALVCLLALGACNRGADKAKPPPAPGPSTLEATVGFQHEPGFDAQGYYRPDAAIAINGMRLTHIAVGSPSDFEAWEAGKRDEVFGPIVVQFLPIQPGEPASVGAGAENELVGVRVPPQAYRVSPGRLSFRGHDPRIGDISFEGAFDTPGLVSARTTGNSDGKPVLKGTLQVGAQKFPDLNLAYWAGD